MLSLHSWAFGSGYCGDSIFIMSKDKEILEGLTEKEYEHGFVTDVEQEFIPKGLNEDIIRLISAKK